MALTRKQKRYWLDLGERTFWTLAEVGVAVVTVEVGNISPSWSVPIAAALAVVKGVVAKHIGNSDSAAIGPEVSPP